MTKYDDSIDCCANCEYLVSTPKNNRYGDMENFCIKTGYYCHGIYKNIHKIKQFSPGGKELPCKYERRKTFTNDRE